MTCGKGFFLMTKTKNAFVTLAVPSFLWGHDVGAAAAILWSCGEDHDLYKEPGALTWEICWATYVSGISTSKLVINWTVKDLMVHTDDSWVFCHLQPKAFLLMNHWLRFHSRVSTGFPSPVFIVLTSCSSEVRSNTGCIHFLLIPPTMNKWDYFPPFSLKVIIDHFDRKLAHIE